MSWYHDEANKSNEQVQADQHRQEIIRQSNFWASLRHQIEADVAGINVTEYWRQRMYGFPLEVKEVDGGYEIRKSGYPAISIIVKHSGDHVEVERHFTEDSLQYEPTEELAIVSDGKFVYLAIYKQRYMIPEEAAKYILTPIIESLKITKPAP